jgi:hypothetical protein
LIVVLYISTKEDEKAIFPKRSEQEGRFEQVLQQQCRSSSLMPENGTGFAEG